MSRKHLQLQLLLKHVSEGIQHSVQNILHFLKLNLKLNSKFFNMCFIQEFMTLHSEKLCAVYRSPNIVRLAIMLMKFMKRREL
jgi:hypothetical protein